MWSSPYDPHERALWEREILRSRLDILSATSPLLFFAMVNLAIAFFLENTLSLYIAAAFALALIVLNYVIPSNWTMADVDDLTPPEELDGDPPDPSEPPFSRQEINEYEAEHGIVHPIFSVEWRPERHALATEPVSEPSEERD